MVDPFLKWAGGKRWLTGTLPVPVSFDRYVEPFLGGGAVFFALSPEKALLSDVNEELIELYRVVRDCPDKLRKLMQNHHRRHSKEYYYQVRSSTPKSRENRAARTLYLNRTCWNGLYRVNLKGQFNVPIGTKSLVIAADENFSEVARMLGSADLICCDFEETLDRCGKGDFVFVDPPYTVKHNLNGFVKYNERIFSWADQIRLRDAVLAAVKRGAAVIVTNADHQSVHELYDGCAEYHTLHRASILAGAGHRRGATTEAMFVANL